MTIPSVPGRVPARSAERTSRVGPDSAANATGEAVRARRFPWRVGDEEHEEIHLITGVASLQLQPALEHLQVGESGLRPIRLVVP